MLNRIQIPIIWPRRAVISDKELLSWCSDARAAGQLPGDEDLRALDLISLVGIASTHGVITTIAGWQNWS